MSKTINTPRPTAAIADDALDSVRCGKEQVRWLGALMTSIGFDLEHNKGRRIADLISLGQYLSEDFANSLDLDVARLESELDAFEARAVKTAGGEA